MALSVTIVVGGLGARAESYLVPILEDQGYHVRTAVGLPALLATLPHAPDLLILDLPSDAELSELANLRNACHCALIVIGPSRNDRLLVKALEIGANDYVQHPFRIDELLARIRAQLRQQERSQSHSLSVGPLLIDLRKRQVSLGGKPLSLSHEEYALLTTLAAQAGFVFPAKLLLTQVWGDEHCAEHSLLSAAIHRLRTLIEDDPRAPRLLLGSLAQGFWLGSPEHEMG